MAVYFWIALGSALGGIARYALTRFLLPSASAHFPASTILINVLGSFVIGFFGTMTVAGGRFAVPENIRMFVMVGICGGFTTFSSFSLQSFDLLRSGMWGRALLNIGLSVVLCLMAVGMGHAIADRFVHTSVIAQTEEEEYTG
jgi:CrcB protein